MKHQGLRIELDGISERLGPQGIPNRKLENHKMRTMKIKVALLVGLAAVLAAGTGHAQAVAYVGSLHMGLSDLNNEVTGNPPTNNALPICAGAGPLVNTDPAGTTEGTLLIAAVGSGSTAVGGTLTFNAVDGGTDLSAST